MSNYPYTRISKEIRKAREDKGLSQRELAKLCGVTQGEIWQIEQGRRYRIDYFLICQIFEILSIEIEKPTVLKVS